MKQQRDAKARRTLYLGIAAVVVLGGGFIAWKATTANNGPLVYDTATGPAQAEGHLLGNANAPVQILEFADFECPACMNFSTLQEPDVRKRIVDAGLASFRYFDFPLDIHRNTIPASLAAACAADQGKFWEMHDRLFQGQPDWEGNTSSNPKRIFKGYAQEVGVANVGQWEECFDARKHLPTIMANRKEGVRRGVGSTPTFVVGGMVIPGALSYDSLKALVETARARTPGGGAPVAGPAGTTPAGVAPAAPAAPATPTPATKRP